MTTTMGIDLGRKHDSTAIVAIERGDDDIVRVRVVRELKRIPFETQVSEIRDLVATYDPYAIAVDETGMGLPVVERLHQEIGARVEGIVFTQNSKAELVARTVALLQDRKLKFGFHPRLREQLHSIRRDVTKDGRILYRIDASMDLTGEHHADLAWALMLAVYSLRDAYDVEPGDVRSVFEASATALRGDILPTGRSQFDPQIADAMRQGFGWGEKMYDPRCGGCGMSLRTASHVKDHAKTGCSLAGEEDV